MSGASQLRRDTPNTNSKYELRSYLESRWRRQSRLAPCETFGFERLLAHPPNSNSSIFNLEFELGQARKVYSGVQGLQAPAAPAGGGGLTSQYKPITV